MFLLDTRGLAAGRYRFAAIGSGKDGEQARADFTVTVGEPKPPTPPTPPDPPKPPEPQPVAGLKVLIVEETAERAKLTPQQLAILSGKVMRDWLDATCSPDSLYPKGYAIWDKDTATTGLPAHWSAALASPRQSLPWVVVMDGKGAVVGGFALPADTVSMIAALGKYVPKQKAG